MGDQRADAEGHRRRLRPASVDVHLRLIAWRITAHSFIPALTAHPYLWSRPSALSLVENGPSMRRWRNLRPSSRIHRIEQRGRYRADPRARIGAKGPAGHNRGLAIAFVDDLKERRRVLSRRGSVGAPSPAGERLAAEARAGARQIRANAGQPTDEKQKRLDRRGWWLLSRTCDRLGVPAGAGRGSAPGVRSPKAAAMTSRPSPREKVLY